MDSYIRICNMCMVYVCIFTNTQWVMLYVTIYICIFHVSIYVTQHEKTRLMYTKYTYSYYSKYLPYCIRFSESVSCMRFLINSYINGENCVGLLCLHIKLFNFEIQKCGQILCAHKTHFLMPGPIYNANYKLKTKPSLAQYYDL